MNLLLIDTALIYLSKTFEFSRKYEKVYAPVEKFSRLSKQVCRHLNDLEEIYGVVKPQQRQHEQQEQSKNVEKSFQGRLQRLQMAMRVLFHVYYLEYRRLRDSIVKVGTNQTSRSRSIGGRRWWPVPAVLRCSTQKLTQMGSRESREQCRLNAQIANCKIVPALRRKSQYRIVCRRSRFTQHVILSAIQYPLQPIDIFDPILTKLSLSRALKNSFTNN